MSTTGADSREQVEAHLPLKGIKVLDFSRIIAGPLSTLYLSDLGADVLKIERVDGGDESRGYGPAAWQGTGVIYLALNRNKRSIRLDLSDSKDLSTAKALAGKADVLVENFRSGVMTKFGLDYEALASINPGLVYCSISGFGSVGPLAGQGANNLIAEAFSGMMAIAGDPPAPRNGPAVADMYTGVNAALAMTAALYERRSSGLGCLVETSLLETQAGLLSYFILAYLASGVSPESSSAAAMTVPNQVFKASDGWLVLAVNSDAMWRRFCEAIGQTEWLTDERLSDNKNRMEHRAEIVDFLVALLAGRPREEWLNKFARARVTAGVVNDIGEFVDHPQVKGLDVILENGDEASPHGRSVRMPFRFTSDERSRTNLSSDVRRHVSTLETENDGWNESDWA